ncbi:MAG: UpxY family transcription antiterminator [Longimicrobiales bacterium]
MPERQRLPDNSAEAANDAQHIPRWYACYTRARHEKRVAGTLEVHGVESFLPLVQRESQWKDRKKLVSFPLFPSYVFGRFALSEIHRVLSIPGVSTIVRVKGQPVPIRDEDIANVRKFAIALANTEEAVESVPYFEEGERVEVTEGPFAGVHGFVVERRSRKRVLVGLEAIGRGMEIDIDTRLLKAVLR